MTLLFTYGTRLTQCPLRQTSCNQRRRLTKTIHFLQTPIQTQKEEYNQSYRRTNKDDEWTKAQTAAHFQITRSDLRHACCYYY
jgi:hypothetical protein